MSRGRCGFWCWAARRKRRRWPARSRAVPISTQCSPWRAARATPLCPRYPGASAASAAWRGWRTTCRTDRIDAVIDATHPFAAQMSRHAVVACRAARPAAAGSDAAAPGRRSAGDRWIEVDDMQAAVAALGVRSAHRVSHRRPLVAPCLRRRAPASLRRAHHRGTRRGLRRAAQDIDHGPRALRHRGRVGPDAARGRRHRGHQEQRRGGDCGQAACRARTRAARRHGAAGRPVMASRRSTTPTSALAWLDAHRPAP